MRYAIVTFRSITPAQRAQIILQREGYACSVRRTPRQMEEQGCGYCIRMDYRDVGNCVQILRNERIPFKKMYILRENGAAEELDL